MGTRADFYVGRGKDAEWLGSIAWDGYPEGNPKEHELFAAKTEGEWRAAVSAMLGKLDHATLPEHGWPWPWEDSTTTDCAYCFFDGKVWCSWWGREFFDPTGPAPEEEGRRLEWPDMKAIQRVTLGKRSGVTVVGGSPPRVLENLP